MKREDLINIVEEYIKQEGLTVSPNYFTPESLIAYQKRNVCVLQAIDLLASIQGWKG